jgi:hypothetical protein
LLVGIAVVLAFATAWELAGALEGRLGGVVRRTLTIASGGRAGSIADTAARLRLPDRIARAGLTGRLDPAAVISGKLAGGALGALAALVIAPALGVRFGLAVAGLLVAGGFLAPDAVLERTARRRHQRLVAALPDALDMLAVGAASGQGPATVFAEVASGTSGPLAGELAVTLAEIDCGAPTATDYAGASAGRRSGPWRRRWSARRGTARRSPSSYTCRRPRCAATLAAGSRTARPARLRRSSSLSRSSSSPRCCWSSSPR